jgi:hypothetical protein
MPESEEQPTIYVSTFVPQAMRRALERSAAQHDRSLSGEMATRDVDGFVSVGVR